MKDITWQVRRFSAFVAFAGCTLAIGQHTPSQTKATGRGTMTGRVFTIAENGDLEPARMANVYIMLMHPPDDTVGLFYLQENSKAIQESGNQIDASGKEWSEQMVCMNQLHAYDPVLVKVLDWAIAKRKTSQIATLTTDEDGRFTTSINPGWYTVVVRGRAGYNDNVWETGPVGDIQVQSAHSTELKLSKPAFSCAIGHSAFSR